MSSGVLLEVCLWKRTCRRSGLLDLARLEWEMRNDKSGNVGRIGNLKENVMCSSVAGCILSYILDVTYNDTFCVSREGSARCGHSSCPKYGLLRVLKVFMRWFNKRGFVKRMALGV